MAKEVSSFLSYFKTPRIDPAQGKRTHNPHGLTQLLYTDWANPVAVKIKITAV